MGCVKTILLAGAATLVGTASFAADMPMPPMMQPPPIEDVGSGWYLRGDIGMTNQSVGNMTNALDSGATGLRRSTGFDASPLVGVGVGFTYNSWLRFDVTGEYRSKANFKGSDQFTFFDGGGTARGHDDYTASKSEWLFMANAYIDLGTWWCVTPFIGAGVGIARTTIHDLRDNGGVFFSDGSYAASAAYGATTSKWNFAWAIHAGLAYKASQNVTFELAYRYLNLGEAESGDLIALGGGNSVYNPMKFRDLDSHDIKFGVRFSLDPEPTKAFPPPLMRRG
jgi:opacity protein-like surface antigen